MNIFTQFFKQAQTDPNKLEESIRNDLIRREAKIGSKIFGSLPKGHAREFFRLDKQTWIWQESWTEKGKAKTKNTKYLIRDREIVKSVNGETYHRVSNQEAENLESAITIYVNTAKKEIYQTSKTA